MKQFFPYYHHLRTVKGPFIIGVLSGLLYAAATGAGIPLMTKVVFPILFHGPAEKDGNFLETWMRQQLGDVSEERLLFFTCLWIPLIFLIRAAAGYTNSYLIQYSGLRVLEGIRTDLFVKLQNLPVSFFKKNRSGDLLARMMQDTEILRQVLAQASSDLIKQPATLLFAVATIVILSIKNHSFVMTLIALTSVPLCVIVIRSAGKRLALKAKMLQKRGGD